MNRNIARNRGLRFGKGVGLVAVLAAWTFGYLLGGWGPRQDLEALRKQQAAERDALQRDGSLRRITSLMQIPDEPTARPRARPSVTAASMESEPVTDAAPEPDEETGDDADEDPPEPSLDERIAAAQEWWRLRVDVARNTFIANAGLNRAEAERFDVLMAAMNLRIQHGFENAAQRIEQDGEVTPEAITRMLHELTGALAVTYDEMDRVLTPDWRAGSGAQPDLFDFVDPSVAEPLLTVEEVLRESRPARWGPRGP